ncbi:MAG: hypothetical protein M0C28_43090 [Candidatus Moduliflexus flocculans]|nr:hypothetical protein [Candidatus Moduliflexus flocculans]
MHPEGLHLLHPPEAQGPARVLGEGRRRPRPSGSSTSRSRRSTSATSRS